MNELINDISKRLKISRIAAGYPTSKDFTEKHSIPSTTYWQHENGKRALTIENLFNYASIINIEPSWLLTGQGNPCSEFGDKDIEQKILEEQEKLGQCGEINASAIPTLSTDNKYSSINVIVFKKILQELIPLLKSLPTSKTEEVIDFCFELYNRIVATNVENKERTKLIKICLESFFSGLGLRVADETLENFSMIS